jgi:DNA-binding transcriptional regulator YiaG
MEAKNEKLTKEKAIATYLNDQTIRVAVIAAAAGISPQRFYQWLKEEGIKPNRKLGQGQQKPRYTSHAKVRWTAQEVKALRSYMGLSQKDLARELGVRQQTISEWETGMYRPRRAMSRYLSMVSERIGFAYKTESKGTPEDDEP